VAIRIPDHPLTSDLLCQLDFPLAAPSANPFGYVSPTTAQHVLDQLAGKIPYIVDGGACQIGLESTIVDFIDGEVVVLRKGGIAIEAIEKIVGEVKVAPYSSSRPSAPGMLEYHYAPKIPLTLQSVENIADQISHVKIGYLGWAEKTSHVPDKNQRILSPSHDFAEAARHFFSYLRELDQLNLEIIVAELAPEQGLGRAINDKLRRAAIEK